MIRRGIRSAAIPLLAILVLGVGTAEAQYRYGGYGLEEQGFFILVEAGFANPRNTDAVVATSQTIVQTLPILPDWSDELAGRVGFGYQWAGGSTVTASVWSMEADQMAAGNGPPGGTLHFAIGPPIPSGSSFIGDTGTPGSYDIVTEISAQLVDVAWGRTHEIADSFTLEWTIGGRLALFEETIGGSYDGADGFDPGSGPILAAKINEGEMFGARATVRGTYRVLNNLSVTGALGFAQLDGELKASSTLTPTGTVGGVGVLPNSSAITDDGRSGSIRDIDVGGIWHSPSEAFEIHFGWEQSVWDQIAADLMRNFPGTTAPLRERSSVTFSSFKVGVKFDF